MLRVQLTPADLGRVRFADSPAPLLESWLAFSETRRAGTPVPVSVRPLRDLLTAPGRGPGFLDPLVTDPGHGFDLVAATPRKVLRGELLRIWQGGRPPLWLRNLADGDRHERQVIGRAVRASHTYFVASRRDRITELFHRDIASRLPTLSHAGVAALLNSLHPRARYDDGVLTLPHPLELDIRLEGQGIELMPTTTWTGHPLSTLSLADPGRFILLYPVADRTTADAERRDRALGRLLGPTRARVLAALVRPATTGELAGRLGISAASASQHTAALRDAGLATSTRDGQRVRHALTSLGTSMLGAPVD